jgi:hypothetical protein
MTRKVLKDVKRRGKSWQHIQKRKEYVKIVRRQKRLGTSHPSTFIK